MLLSHPERRAVSNAIFAVTVVVLLAIAAGGFLLCWRRPVMQETMTVTTTDNMSHPSSSGVLMATTHPTVAFMAAHGQMFGNGWLLGAPLGNGSYAVSLYATGLEPAAVGDYIVEAAQNAGKMAIVPIAGTNATLSEFTADSHGVGQFFVILRQEPTSIYESVSILYLPGCR